jgi:hypothetical protein
VSQCASNAWRTPRSSARDPDAVAHHSRVPARGADSGGKRRCRSRGVSLPTPVAWRVAPDEVPGADCDGRVGHQQLAVRGVTVTAGDTTLAACCDQLPRGRCVPVGGVRIEHEPDSHPAPRRTNQVPSVRRTDFIQRGIDAHAGITEQPRQQRSRSIRAERACQRRHARDGVRRPTPPAWERRTPLPRTVLRGRWTLLLRR